MSETIVVANRSDGLGQRLWALVNAIVVADVLPAKFSLVWPDDNISSLQEHAIEPAERVFSSQFLADHPPVSVDGATRFFAGADISQLVGQTTISEPNDLSLYFPRLSVQASAISAAFNKIGWSERIQNAIAEAKRFLVVAGSTALHLRAGDIVYGHYRFEDRFTSKVVSYPIAEAIIRKIQEKRGNVLLFGQDKNLMRYLSEKYGLQSPKYDGDADQSAIFEMLLMSRCSQIFAGSSGFAMLAALIGEARREDLRLAFPLDETVDLYRRELRCPSDEIPPFQKAFASWSAFKSCQTVLSHEEQTQLVSQAIRYDPENDFYRIVLASLHYAQGNNREGEATLSGCQTKNIPGSIWRVIKPKGSNGSSPASKFVKSYARAASEGCYRAKLALGINHFFQGNIDKAATLALECNNEPQGQHDAILRRLQNQIGMARSTI